MKNKKSKFNGLDFDKRKQRSRMKYIAVTTGDLDLNGCIAFKTKRSLREYIEGLEDVPYKKVLAVFKIENISDELLEE